MSQLISCKNKHGIVLAADAKGIDFNTKGEILEVKVERLFQLTKHSAILTGGAPEGANMCGALRDFVVSEGLDDIVDVHGAALPFLASQYEQFMRKECEILPLDPIHHVHFILGGYTEKDPKDTYRLYLIWTKKKLPQLDGDEIATAFTVPRIMRLEYRLNQFSKENAPLNQILPEVRTNLEKQANIQEEIGPPFSYAFITGEGFTRVS